VGGGCGALLNLLSFLLLDKGDCVLLPTPTYAMLYNDLSSLAGVEIVDVPCSPGSPLTPELLSAAEGRAAARGLRVRALLLLNPDNPLGTVREPQEVRQLLAWCDERELHVISDEIYALSVWEGEPFTSTAAIRWEQCQAAAGSSSSSSSSSSSFLGDRTHILWGFSKDFCASGLRLGVLFSHNQQLLTALDNVSYFTAAPNPIQDMVGEMLGDEAWLEGFLAGNKNTLVGAAQACATALTALSIPYVPARAGMFLWVDLSSLLPEGSSDAAREEALTLSLFREARVLLTPGLACHASAPGFYRLCFAWPSHLESLQEALRRLTVFVQARRRSEE